MLVLKNNNVSHIMVPQYETLDGPAIRNFAKGYIETANYLCDDREIESWPRGYVCDVINSIVGEPFRAWVMQRIKDRNEVLGEGEEVNIEMDRDVHEAFMRSTYVSSK